MSRVSVRNRARKALGSVADNVSSSKKNIHASNTIKSKAVHFNKGMLRFVSRITSDTSEFVELARKITTVEEPPFDILLLHELFITYIMHSTFHNSELFSQHLNQVLSSFSGQINAEDYVCTHFLKDSTSISLPECKNLQLTPINIMSRLRNHSWRGGSLYSVCY